MNRKTRLYSMIHAFSFATILTWLFGSFWFYGLVLVVPIASLLRRKTPC